MPDRLPGVVVEALRQLDLAQHLRLVGERPHDEELAALGADDRACRRAITSGAF